MQLTANTDALKEPRGFIKLIEIILAICAFATAVGPHIAVTFKCCGTDAQTIQLSMHYPYQVSETNSNKCECSVTSVTPASTSSSTPANTTGGTTETTPTSVTTTSVPLTSGLAIPTVFQLPAECQSSSEFYVFVGVTAFLFSLAAMVFYVFAYEQYAGLGIIPKADFVVTVIFTLFWLISSAAFAAALTKIKNSADPSWLGAHSGDSCYSKCTSSQDGNYSTLNVSVIFGFLNMIVWGGNNWFLYKETNWFGADSPSQPMPSQSMPTSTSEINPNV